MSGPSISALYSRLIQQFSSPDPAPARGALLSARMAVGDALQDSLFTLFDRHPALEQSIRRAVVERLIVGDYDSNPQNLIVPFEDDPMAPRVQNTDVEQAFVRSRRAQWFAKLFVVDPVGSTLQRCLGRSPIPDDVLDLCERFLVRYETPGGRQELEQIGFSGAGSDEEITALFGRTRDLLEERVIPPAYFD